jgi:hypothetical protein
MKGPKDLKNYVARHREYLKSIRWDDLYVMKLQATCKKWFKREKKIKKDEWQ